jgi:SOS-response transcriptional repressor LexA
MRLMDEVAADHRLIKELVDAEGSGIPSRIAKDIGVAASTINRHYNGTAQTKLSRPIIEKLRARYPNFHGWLTFGSKVRSEVSAFGDRPFEEKFGESPLPAIPLVGSAIGMKSFDPERDIELTELDTSEVLDRVARPTSLAGDGAAYALTVIGDSMSPKFDPGTRIIVSPKAPVHIRDYVVVQMKGPDPEDQYEERVTTVLIKRLVRRSATFIELQQFNPDVTFRVGTDRIAATHKVIGEVY